METQNQSHTFDTTTAIGAVIGTPPIIAPVVVLPPPPTPEQVAAHLARHRQLMDEMKAEAAAAIHGLRAQRQALTDEAKKIHDDYNKRIDDMDEQINTLAAELGQLPPTIVRTRQSTAKIKEYQDKVIAYLSTPERKGQWVSPGDIRTAVETPEDPNNRILGGLVESKAIESNGEHATGRRYRVK